MNAPTANILAAVQLATGVHPRRVNNKKLREAQRAAAILLRDERGMSVNEISRELGISRYTLWTLMRTGPRPDGVASALEQARKLLRGQHR